MNRRDAVGVLLGSAGALLAWGRTRAARGSARLAVKFTRPTAVLEPGLHPLGLGGERDGLLYVPAGYTSARPAPLVLALHGATGSAQGPLRFLRAPADEHGFIVLSVDSRDMTWDGIGGEYGADVEFITRAINQTYTRCAVDPKRVIIEGFSDGASYGLGLGLANGDVFSRIMAFSPGFIPDSDSPARGRPPIFISHGFHDPVLPKVRTSDLLVPRLSHAGYKVTYLEFDGGHTVAPEALEAAMKWAALAP